MSDLESPDIAPEPPTRRQDRRSWLKEVGAAGAGAMIGGTAISQPATTGTILSRTSTTGVFIPPRGRGFMKFSFDCPEPSVAFEGFEFSFRVFTQENTYSLSADHLAVRASDNRLEVRCDELPGTIVQSTGLADCASDYDCGGGVTALHAHRACLPHSTLGRVRGHRLEPGNASLRT